MGDLGIFQLLVLVIVAAVAIAAAKRKLGFSNATHIPKNSALSFNASRILIVGTLGLVTDWAIYRFNIVGIDSPGPFYWAESITASVFFATIAVAAFSFLRRLPALLTAGILAAAYALFIDAIYIGVTNIVEIGWLAAAETLVASLSGPGYYEDSLELLVRSPVYALHGLVIITAALVLTGGRNSTQSEQVQALGYGGRVMNSSSGETMRLLLGSAILNGTLFRRKVIDRAEETHLAKPPEPGINMAFLSRVCKTLERRETAYQAIYLLLFVIGILSLSTPETQPIAVLVFLLAVVLHLYRDARKRFQLAASLQEGIGRPEEIIVKALGLPPEAEPSPTATDDTAIVYRGFDPFESFGTNIAHLSFSVDIGRLKSGEAGSGHVSAFSTAELYDALKEQTVALQLPEVEIADRLFVNGEDLPSKLSVNRYGPPQQQLTLDEIVALDASPISRARRYECFMAKDWGGEMVVSFFISCVIRGRTLFVEISGRLLPPLSSSYREIERIPPRTFHTLMGWFIGTAVVAPFAAGFGALIFIAKIFEAINEVFGTAERARKREIDVSPRYNFGAKTGLRREFASQQFVSYFQRMDMDYYVGTFNQSLFTVIVDFLDEHGIDTSNLKDQQVAILNSGVLIQGGNLTAQNLAVGEGARASLLRKLSRKADTPDGKKAA